ncbi:uncharacterized protein CC84DRAFT_1163878, partial [Paraphaeosphaeria sporulosa]
MLQPDRRKVQAAGRKGDSASRESALPRLLMCLGSETLPWSQSRRKTTARSVEQGQRVLQ